MRNKPGPTKRTNDKPVAKSVNPTAIALADAARLLTRVGGRSLTKAQLAADVASGAPKNSDGTINLLHYGAWLVQQMAKKEKNRDGE